MGTEGDKNRVTPVFKLLDDEGGNECFFDLRQRGPPNILALVTRDAMRQAADDGISGNFLEEGFLNKIPNSCRPQRVRTVTPTRMQTVNTNKTDNSFSAGTQSGMSCASGRTTPATDFVALSINNTAR